MCITLSFPLYLSTFLSPLPSYMYFRSIPPLPPLPSSHFLKGCSLISVEEITYLIIPVEMTEDVNTIAISVGVLGIVVGAIEVCKF